MEILCSYDEMLADYFEGRLSDEDRIEMEAHLSKCNLCRETLVAVNGVVRGQSRFQLEDAPKEVTEAAVCLINKQICVSCEPLIQRVRRFVIGMPFYKMLNSLYTKISEFFTTPWAGWRLAPIRGSERTISKDLINVRKRFNGIETEIEIEKTGHNKARIRVELPEYDTQKKKLRVTLKRDDREISSFLLNVDRVFFEDIPFGHYSLIFVRDDAKIGTYLFEIRETRHDG